MPKSTATTTQHFSSVEEAAATFGVSPMTLYRAIRDGRFPAVRVGRRILVPCQAIHEMVTAALTGPRLVDAAEWVTNPPIPRSQP